MKQVTDMRTLNALAKAGHITLHEQTGKKVYWNGRYFKTYYIDDYKQPTFSHNGITYVAKFIDGCFNPFVFFQTN